MTDFKDLFEYAVVAEKEELQKKQESTFAKTKLTPRQQMLRNFYYAFPNKKWKNQAEQVSDYEHWLLEMNHGDPKYSYNYFEDERNETPVHNMGSLRALRSDLYTLRTSNEVQKVITRNGYPHSETEANEHLDGIWADIAARLKSYHSEKKKLAKNGFQRLVFGSERAEIQAILADEEDGDTTDKQTPKEGK